MTVLYTQPSLLDGKTCSDCHKYFVNAKEAFQIRVSGRFAGHFMYPRCKACEQQRRISTPELRQQYLEASRRSFVRQKLPSDQRPSLARAPLTEEQITERILKERARGMAKYHKAYSIPEKREHIIRLAARGVHKRRTLIGKSAKHYSIQEWYDLCAKYDQKCLGCGIQPETLTVDHIVPLSKGGSNTIDNIQPLCKPCNSSKHVKIIDYRPKEATFNV